MARQRIIVQLDDEVAQAMLVRGRGKRAKVLWTGTSKNECPDDLVRFVKEQAPIRNTQKTDLLLMISDRRIINGRIENDAAPHRRELAEMLRRSAFEQGMFSEAEQLAMGYSVTETRDHWRATFVACPEDVFVEFVNAFRAAGFGTIRVLPTENVLAQGLAGTTEVRGIVDMRGASVFFVLARNGEVIAVRKILVPNVGGDDGIGGPESMLMLGADLTRTIEYFSDQGLPNPQGIVFTTTDLDEETASALSEILEVPCEAGAPPALGWMSSEGEPDGARWRAHSYAVAALNPKRSPFLMQSTVSGVARSGRRGILPITGTAAAAAGACLLVLEQQPERQQRVRDFETTTSELEELYSELSTERDRHAVPAIVIERRHILKSMQARRSISRICAVLGNNRPGGMGLLRIQLSNRRFTLTGLIDDESGLTALDRFSELDERIRAIPGVTHGSGKLQPLDPKYRGLPFEYRFELDEGS